MEYRPSEQWLLDMSQPYSGGVRIVKENIEGLESILGSGILTAKCEPKIYSGWTCSFGNAHGPGECNADSFTYEISVSNNCSGGGGSGGSLNNNGGFTQVNDPLENANGGAGGSENASQGSNNNSSDPPGLSANNGMFTTPLFSWPFEDKIIYDNQLLEDYPCQSEIIKDALAANSTVTDLVMDIFNSNVKPTITIQANNLNGILEGGNTHAQNGNPLHYFITMNTQRLDVSTDIDIASTAIHESVHALLFYFYQAGSFQSNNESYAQLVEDFTIHQASFGGDHHEYMQNFVGDIADSLYSWSINNNYLPNNFTEYDTNDSNNYDGLREYLGKLAWNGLTDTGAFELLYPEGTLERQNIIQLINSESLPYENSANPFGTPCD